MKASDVLARYKPAQRQVRILLDGTLQARLDDARTRLRAEIRKGDDTLASGVPAIEQEIRDIESEADEASVVFTIQAVPGADFDQLKLSYPPTAEQWEKFREAQKGNPLFSQPPEFDPERVAPDLIGLSIVAVDEEPVDWTEDDGRELWATLHDGARADLLEAVWGVNGQRSNRPLSATATGTTTNSGSGSTTPQNEESLSVSSLDG